jgi:hypothetical protein
MTEADELRAECNALRAQLARLHRAAIQGVTDAWSLGQADGLGARGLDPEAAAPPPHWRKFLDMDACTTSPLSEIEPILEILRLHEPEGVHSVSQAAVKMAALWKKALVALGTSTVERERAEARARTQQERADRFWTWLSLIEGGDRPCEDAQQLRAWAYRAAMGQEPPNL